MAPGADRQVLECDVCIVGGGISGSALRRFLGLHNIGGKGRSISSILFEKDLFFGARKQGYALTIQQGGRALKQLNLDDDVQKANTHCGVHYCFDPVGKLKCAYGEAVYQRNGGGDSSTGGETSPEAKFDEAQASRSRNAAKRGKKDDKKRNLHITRETLRALLQTDLKAGDSNGGWDDATQIMWGWTFQGFEECEATSENNDPSSDRRLLVKMSKTEESSSSAPNSEANAAGISASADDVYVACSVLVGADGIYSQVRRHHLERCLSPGYSDPLEYLGVCVVLGICPIGEHFLRQNTIWQTAGDVSEKRDGEEQSESIINRLYAMPFSSTELFWQLSFPISVQQARELRYLESTKLKEYLLDGRHLGRWHEPVPELVRDTPSECIMVTPAYDRGDSYPFCGKVFERDLAAGGQYVEKAATDGADERQQAVVQTQLPVTLLGDAAHPLSMFKGQGANLALTDAIELGEAILDSLVKRRSNIVQSLRKFEQKMYDRSQRKVQESRRVANSLHGFSECSKSKCQKDAAGTEGQSLNTSARGLSDEMMRKIAESGLGVWNSREELLNGVGELYSNQKLSI